MNHFVDTSYPQLAITEHIGTGSLIPRDAQEAGGMHLSSSNASTNFSNPPADLLNYSTFPMTGGLGLIIVPPYGIDAALQTPDSSTFIPSAMPDLSSTRVVGPPHIPHFSVETDILDQMAATENMRNDRNLAGYLRPQHAISKKTGSLPTLPVSIKDGSENHVFEIKRKIHKVLRDLKDSDTIEDAVKRVKGLDLLNQTHIFRDVFHEALDHLPKVSPASKSNADGRRKREATFKCILCATLLTTKNNLHSKSLQMCRLDS